MRKKAKAAAFAVAFFLYDPHFHTEKTMHSITNPPEGSPASVMHLPIPKHPKQRGEWVELLFMATAARHGLKLAKPHGDSAQYDLIVESGGRLLRVQVKSTSQSRSHNYYCHAFWSTTPRPSALLRTAKGIVHLARKNHRKVYSARELDFVCAYVIPEDSWFIIPVSEIHTKGLYLPSLANPNPGGCRTSQYREAWQLLGATDFGATFPTLSASSEEAVVRS